MDQTNKTIRSPRILSTDIFFILVRKLIDPPIEEAPAKCKENNDISTAGPLCPV
jgi:hypothetical protein